MLKWREIEMKSVVVEIMEKRLSPYGFQYVGVDYLLWIFSRETEGMTQYIAMQKNRWEDAYALNIYAYGEGQPAFESKDLSNEPEYKFQFFHFNSEKERIAVLNKLLDIAEKYGIDKLNELTQKEKSIPFEPIT